MLASENGPFKGPFFRRVRASAYPLVRDLVSRCLHDRLPEGGVGGELPRQAFGRRADRDQTDRQKLLLDLGWDGRAGENTELEPRELADRNEILGHCRSKGGTLIGIWDEQELAAIRARIASQSAP